MAACVLFLFIVLFRSFSCLSCQELFKKKIKNIIISSKYQFISLLLKCIDIVFIMLIYNHPVQLFTISLKIVDVY